MLSVNRSLLANPYELRLEWFTKGGDTDSDMDVCEGEEEEGEEDKSEEYNHLMGPFFLLPIRAIAHAPTHNLPSIVIQH